MTREIKEGYIYTANGVIFAQRSVIKSGTMLRVDSIDIRLRHEQDLVILTDPSTGLKYEVTRDRFENGFELFAATIVSPRAQKIDPLQ